MAKIGDRVITHTPARYERQQGMTCGETNVRTIVEGFGKEYHPMSNPPVRVHLYGFSFVKDIQRLVELNGLVTYIQHASKLDDQTKIETIQKHIDHNEPVLIAIGNGHLKRNKFSRLAQLMLGHFITIYGYNADQKVFYIYDAWLEGEFDGEIPVGNEVRTYAQLLSSWKGPLYYGLINMRNIYLPMRAG
ncbi:MAG: hypothetical protein FP831_15805 [Anaerolineae bacterium]|nr:hypothetical protein [Anaerolineae bacterium]